MSNQLFPELSGIGDAATGIADLGNLLFGTKEGGSQSNKGTTKTNRTARQRQTGTASERVRVDRAAIDRTIQEVLSGNEGLADILLAEQGAGVFDSTVAQEAVQELVAKVAGEVAKLETTTTQAFDTGTTTEEKIKQKQKSESKTKGDSEGIVDRVLGGIF